MKKRIIALLCLLALSVSSNISVFAKTNTVETTEIVETVETVTPTVSPDVTENPQETDAPINEEVTKDETVTTPAPDESAEPAATTTPVVTIEPSKAPDIAIDPKLSLSELNLHIVINHRKYVKDSFVKVELYDKNDNLLGTDREWVGGITKAIDLNYAIPDGYALGDTFKVKLVEGAESLSYYGKKIKPDESLEVKTGYYYNKNNEFVAENTVNLNAIPLWEKEVIVYVNDEKVALKPRARIVNDYTLIPVRGVAEAMGLKVFYDKDYDSVVCSIGEDEIIFNLGSTYATFFGKTTYLPVAPCYIQGSAYIPVRPLVEAFKASLDVKDFGDHLDIIIGESEIVKEFKAKSPVNQWNISSRTDYMVWVDKSEYKTRLYEGSKNNWTLIYEATCAIGAPGTPTITGSYEFIERTHWDYGTYYVGPVLRFYNGYALHSTLRYYGGGEYDGRVGVQISHGCIRLKPDDITYIANTVPLGTRIYITE